MAEGAEGFDLEAAIAEFQKDESRTSMELPTTLTADQRKQAKRLCDAIPGVKCESYGFGAERKLHLFKQSGRSPGAVPSAGVIGQGRDGGGGITVKNTFIDGWAEDGGGDSEEQLICRSMPAGQPQNLLERTLQRCLQEGPMAGIDERSERSERASPGSPRGSASAGASHREHSPNPSSAGGSSAPELPALPEGLKVRNTFIHIETMPTVERIVQSMPDGMFRQCLQAELSAQQTIDEAPSEPPTPGLPYSGAAGAGQPWGATPVPPVSPGVPLSPAPASPPRGVPPSASSEPLACGTEVQIHDLVKLPDFNGLSGVVQNYDADTGRYDVLLDSPAGACAWRWVKVKINNLVLRIPPPPAGAPHIQLESREEVSASAPEGVSAIGLSPMPSTPTWEDGPTSFPAPAGQNASSGPVPGPR